MRGDVLCLPRCPHNYSISTLSAAEMKRKMTKHQKDKNVADCKWLQYFYLVQNQPNVHHNKNHNALCWKFSTTCFSILWLFQIKTVWGSFIWVWVLKTFRIKLCEAAAAAAADSWQADPKLDKILWPDFACLPTPATPAACLMFDCLSDPGVPGVLVSYPTT